MCVRVCVAVTNRVVSFTSFTGDVSASNWSCTRCL